MSIDLGDVPEGATHYNNESEDFYASWYKVVDGEITHYNEFGDMWIPASDSCVFPKVSDLQAIASRWTGEGLPPVGTVCEYLGAHQYDQWSKVNIFAQWKDLVFVDFGDGWRQERDPSRFRPIRTPEQIAAEEREKTIAELKKVFDSISHELCQTSNKYLETLFGAIHDAGWKQVKP